MRGFFGIGVVGASKSMNVGSLFRTAHAFGASFVFTAGAAYKRRVGRGADTSNAPEQVPFYEFPDFNSVLLPQDTEMVGIEIVDDAIELPSFHHPRQAAYVLGAERTTLPDEVLARCRHRVRIPTRFSINVALAGAIVMYDRMISLGRFARRPLSATAAPEPLPEHVYGDPRMRKRLARFRAAPPVALAFAFAVLLAGGAAEAQTFIGNYNDWSAFHDGAGKDKACYVASLPSKTLPAGVNRGKTYVLVTHRPGEKARDVFELRAGYVYKEGSEVEISIDGNKPIKLFTHEGSAWAPDAGADSALAEAMKKGRMMVISGMSSRGTKTTDSYSLAGFTAAHNTIDKECP